MGDRKSGPWPRSDLRYPHAAEVERAMRLREALKRERGRSERRHPDGGRAVGHPLKHDQIDGRTAWTLDGAELRPGDVIEVFTNQHTQWLRGRFEWDVDNERPSLAINVWDPDGPEDEDGLPPWIGELTCPIPAGAICRRATIA